jgi:prefoldin subunit 5
MKLLSFGKKGYPALPSPTDRVVALSSQGLAEPEIIEVLRQEGYTPVQVDNAMKDALRGAATGMPPRAPPVRQAPQAYAPAPPQEYNQQQIQRRPQRPYSPYAESQEAPQPPQYQKSRNMPQPPFDYEEFKNTNRDLGFPELPEVEKDTDDDLDDMPPLRRETQQGRPEALMPEDDLPEYEEELRPLSRLAPRTRPDMRTEKRRALEELTESVVEEKWDDFSRRIESVNGKFQQLNDRIASLEQRIGQMQGDKKSDLMEIEGKIDTYKQSIDEIDSRMESVERAMKDSLTPMMQTLRSLSETIKSLKEKR